MLEHCSLSDLPEGRLVKNLLADAHWRTRVIGLSGIPADVIDYLEVPLNGLQQLQGDIDILLVPPGRPDRATAIQVKRLKVHETSFVTEMPGKLSELSKLQRQVNPLAAVGFWQVFSFVFVAVDSRINNAGQFSYAGLTPILRTKIESAISLEGLDPRVGLVHFEFVQPIDHYPLGAGTYSVRPRRMAQLAVQPSDITEWVKRAIQSANAQPSHAADSHQRSSPAGSCG